MNKYNVGIIGAGGIIHPHLAVLLNMNDINIKWVSDINKTNLMKIKKAYKITTVDLNDSNIDFTNIDILLMLVPYGVREKYFDLLKGIPIAVYVEKPFAKIEKEHLDICSGFEPFKLAVGFQRRALGKVAIIRKVIEEQLFGKLSRIHYEWGNTRVSRGISYQNDPKLSGGGILFDVAIHGVDNILFITRAEDVIIKSKKIVFDEELKIDVHSEIEFNIISSPGYSVSCKSIVSQLTNTSNLTSLEFENANVEFNLFNEDPIKVIKNNSLFNLSDTSLNNLPSTSHQVFYIYWRSFLTAIESKQINYTSAIDTLMTTRFIENVYK